jgi:uncharacterized protein YbaP (TraB family)
MTPARALRIVPLLLLATFGAPTRAADHPTASPHHSFWAVQGRYNTVYLLGSVHMLKPIDSALPEEALQAYQHAKALVMEVDLSQVNAESLGTGLELAMLPAGQTLPMVLGAELYARFKTQAQHLGLDAQIMDGYQPWFAALVLQQAELSQSGFDTGAGVDEQFAARAEADQKPIIGLETLQEQLGYFAQLSLDEQRDYLRTSLEDSANDERETGEVVRAWQSGDTAELERLLREGSKDSPALYSELTTGRNHKWLPRIDQMLAEHEDYLIVVGALHLVGRDGLVELLRAQGYAVVQH